MANILFIAEPNLQAADELHSKLIHDTFSSDFSAFDSEEVAQKIESGEVELICAYLHEMSSESKHNFLQILNHDSQTPFMLCGTHEELHKYYERVNARVIRYLQTPITINDFIEVLKEELSKLRGTDITEEKKEEPEAPKNTRKHILIVDDDPVTLRTIMNWLKNDYVTSVVKSGAQALAFLGKEIPDLILLDYEMPVMNGVQTLEAIRSEDAYKNIPVMFLTGVSDLDCVREAIKLKPVGYVLKSENENAIKAKISDIFERLENNQEYKFI